MNESTDAILKQILNELLHLNDNVQIILEQIKANAEG